MVADLVLANGSVFLVDRGSSVQAGLAVEGGRIVAVGHGRDLDGLTGPQTRVIDLGGRMVVPGFQDAHVHPARGGLSRLRCDLEPARSPTEALTIVAGYAAEHPGATWIRGGGWKYAWFPDGNPPAELLDELFPDRPVCLSVADGHSYWANTAALVLAGITAETPDPTDGRIVRLPGGSPQGTLHEGAMTLLDRVIPADGVAELKRGLLEGQQYLLSKGVTAWQDAWVTPELHQAYLELVDEDRLIASVRGALWWEREEDVSQIDELLERRSQGRGRYRPGTVKLMLDGVVENFTASMLESYLDRDGLPTGHRGVDFIDPELVAEAVSRLDAAGFQCHFHALGDRAVRSALDAVEVARARNGASDHRHLLAHLQVVDPRDLPRFSELDVIANLQPLWACNEPSMTELTVPFLGPGRARLQYPFGDLVQSGAKLAMGSDWPVSTGDVMQQISVATERTVPGVDSEPFLPEQRIGLHRALLGFTAGSAFANHLDGDRGTIRPGAVADLAVLSADPYSAEALWKLSVDLTVVAGQIVYGDDR